MLTQRINFPKDGDVYNKLLFKIEDTNLDIQFGTVFLKKGTRIPKKGFTKHPQHEISIIQEGKIAMLNEDETIKGYIQKGEVVYIKALEAQAGNVLEDTKIIYVLLSCPSKEF